MNFKFPATKQAAINPYFIHISVTVKTFLHVICKKYLQNAHTFTFKIFESSNCECLFYILRNKK